MDRGEEERGEKREVRRGEGIRRKGKGMGRGGQGETQRNQRTEGNLPLLLFFPPRVFLKRSPALFAALPVFSRATFQSVKNIPLQGSSGMYVVSTGSSEKGKSQ